jgi:hypothetical protein
VRQVTSDNNVQIVPSAETQYFGMTFSADGNSVYYVIVNKHESEAFLYQVPVLGGTPRKLVDDIDAPVALSPDGKQLAFVRFYPPKGTDDLLIANADGSGEHAIGSVKLPARYASSWFGASAGPSWSRRQDHRHPTMNGNYGTGGTLVSVPVGGGRK